MNNLHLIVSEQFPEFIRSDYPVFVEFVKAYYKWLEEQGVGKIEDVASLDSTLDEFVRYFKDQLDVDGLLINVVPFNKLYLQRIKEIYSRKGSEDALVNLLKIASGSTATVRYPSENILKASDGRWIQQNFITVNKIYGTLPGTINEFHIVYEFSTYQVQITKYEEVDTDKIRLYYRPSTNIPLSLGQTVYIHNDVGQAVYAAKIIKSPSRVEVTNGGKNWQLGQIIRIPGTQKDTIARVAKVDSIGAIQRVEILEYGYTHSENETIIVSPYPNKPLGATYDLVSELTSIDPVSYSYTLTLNDYTDGSTENVTGILSGINSGSYFLSNYVNAGYVGSIVLDQNTVNVDTDVTPNPDILLEEWFASRATIVLKFEAIVKEKGKWADQKGQISNQAIRLEDNYYYQQFSYDVEADTDNSQYIDLVRTIHPVGMKLFTTYGAITELAITPTGETAFPFITIDLLDVAQTDDNNAKIVTKKLVDATLASDDLSFSLNKYLSDSATVTSADTTSTEYTLYNEDVEEYFAEGYAKVETILNIGV